jgi:RNA polymerase sigma-54 factor
MALGQRLILKQGQSLVMTPQLQQAIKLLQMSHVELMEFVDVELERNPLLERDEGSSIKSEPATEQGSEPSSLDTTFSAPGTGGDSPTEAGEAGSDDGSRGEGSDAAMAAQGPMDSGWSSLRSSGQVSFDEDGNDFISTVSKAESLADVLTRQLNLHFKSAQDRAIGQYLIGMVNEAGYLIADLAAVAETLGCAQSHIDFMLETLKTFEPTGVFARDLGECLRLQLKERNHLDPAMDTLLNHLPLVARRDFQQLKSICKLGIDDIQDMVSELKTLNPKPGLAFGSEPVAPVIPDVFVRPAPDGNWIVELNSETLPRILVNNQYMAKVSRGATAENDKTFLSEAHSQAAWLVKSLDQRAKTILKVAREIVRQQDGFLMQGIQHLRPITLKTIADLVEMHESTVSRVTSNKYMATPRGTYELKFFFTNAIAGATADSETHSSESVRHRIRELVQREEPGKVLSDDDLVTQLRAEGIDIARRTVAKYRESLNIPSSVLRRREARLKS